MSAIRKPNSDYARRNKEKLTFLLISYPVYEAIPKIIEDIEEILNIRYQFSSPIKIITPANIKQQINPFDYCTNFEKTPRKAATFSRAIDKHMLNNLLPLPITSAFERKCQ